MSNYVEISCVELDNPSNGNIECNDTNMHESTCSFQCNQGYYLDGSSSAVCVQDSEISTGGSWSNDLPQCRSEYYVIKFIRQDINEWHLAMAALLELNFYEMMPSATLAEFETLEDK